LYFHYGIAVVDEDVVVVQSSFVVQDVFPPDTTPPLPTAKFMFLTHILTVVNAGRLGLTTTPSQVVYARYTSHNVVLVIS
jgi:hypothetical protein